MLYGRGLCDLLSGEATEDAQAAAINIADVLSLVYAYLTRE